jgi:alginate O-acetyltransferase complex protein AlgI
MTTLVRKRTAVKRGPAAWLPLAALPLGCWLLTAGWPAWARMWSLAISIFAGLKWLTFASSVAGRAATWQRSASYLLLWTGMDAKAFFTDRANVKRGGWHEWLWAVGQILAGLWLLVGVAPRFVESQPLVAGWLTMAGVVSILHFGLSRVLSLTWRAAGVDARHIMHKPLFAGSLADFWGRRWNLAFRDVAHRFVFQPLVPHVGAVGATIGVFLVSGLIHDAVISLAAGGGWGLPTLYFLIQGGAVLVERSRFGRRIGFGRGLGGRLWATAIIVAPARLLFHPPFMTRVVLPMLDALQTVLP